MMHISGLTVCVNYADLLAKSIQNWINGLESLIVVTDHQDQDTENLILNSNRGNCLIALYKTDIFYADGAVFNKARAICEAFEALGGWADWQLLFDADIIPPPEWRTLVNNQYPAPGYLYGARRLLEDGTMFCEGELAGYFQLFHKTDIYVQRKPLLETNWRHAGSYDSEFHYRWPPEKKIFMPINLVHQGTPGENWWGRGKIEDMQRMRLEREKAGGIWKEERINHV